MNDISILVLIGLAAFVAWRLYDYRSMQKRLPRLADWVEVLSAGDQVLMVGRKMAAIPRLGKGAYAVWGAIAVDQVDPALMEDIATVTEPVYIDAGHIFAKIIVAANEDETVIIGDLVDAAMIQRLEAAIAEHADTTVLRLQVASQAVSLVKDPEAQRTFDELWSEGGR